MIAGNQACKGNRVFQVPRIGVADDKVAQYAALHYYNDKELQVGGVTFFYWYRNTANTRCSIFLITYNYWLKLKENQPDIDDKCKKYDVVVDIRNKFVKKIFNTINV